MIYSKRKEFAPPFTPKESKFFTFRIDPFSEGEGVQESKEKVIKVVCIVKHGKSAICIQ